MSESAPIIRAAGPADLPRHPARSSRRPTAPISVRLGKRARAVLDDYGRAESQRGGSLPVTMTEGVAGFTVLTAEGKSRFMPDNVAVADTAHAGAATDGP